MQIRLKVRGEVERREVLLERRRSTTSNISPVDGCCPSGRDKPSNRQPMIQRGGKEPRAGRRPEPCQLPPSRIWPCDEWRRQAFLTPILTVSWLVKTLACRPPRACSSLRRAPSSSGEMIAILRDEIAEDAGEMMVGGERANGTPLPNVIPTPSHVGL